MGSLLGAVIMALFSIVSNYYLVYPAYYKLMVPEETVFAAYQKILPSVENMLQCLLYFNMTFTLVK